MRSARKYNERITTGRVPDSEDLRQLQDLGYRTLVDVRDEKERFGGWVEERARELGFDYINIPISREVITLADVETFYRAVFGRGTAPVYAFSRFGKKPLAFLILLDAAVRGESVHRMLRRANALGLTQGDLSLQTFIVQLTGQGKYLLTQRSLQGGSYSASIESSPVGPEGGQQVVEATLAAVNELFSDQSESRASHGSP